MPAPVRGNAAGAKSGAPVHGVGQGSGVGTVFKESRWCLWYDANGAPDAVLDTEGGGCRRSRIRRVATVSSVDALSIPFKEVSSSLLQSLYGGSARLFRANVLPLMGDAANRHGGQWSLRLDDWEESVAVWNLLVSLLLAPNVAADVVASPLSAICGAVLSRTGSGETTLSLWLGGVDLTADLVAATGRAFAALAAAAWVKVPSDWCYQQHSTLLRAAVVGGPAVAAVTTPSVVSSSSSFSVTTSELKKRSRSIDGETPAMENLPVDQLLAVRYASQLLEAACAVSSDNVSVKVDVPNMNVSPPKMGRHAPHSEGFLSVLGQRSRSLYYAIPATAVISVLGYVSFSAWGM